jgi:hypothetical protein
MAIRALSRLPSAAMTRSLRLASSVVLVLAAACGDGDDAPSADAGVITAADAAAGDGGATDAVAADGAAIDTASMTQAPDAATIADALLARDTSAQVTDVKLAWTGVYAAYQASNVDVLLMAAQAKDPKNIPILVEKPCPGGGRTVLKGTATSDIMTRKSTQDFVFTLEACKHAYQMDGMWTVKTATEATVNLTEEIMGAVKFTGFLDRTCGVNLKRMITATSGGVGAWTGTFCDEDVTKW